MLGRRSVRCIRALPWILCLMVGMGVGTVHAQEGATVSGVINDAGGLPLPGASVTALHIGSGRTTEVVTDEVGKYTIEGLIPGEYRITARLEGFSASGQTARLSRGEALDLTVMLELGGLTEEITVTAAKGERATADIPQIVTIVGEAKIERRRPPGILEAIERTPGIRTVETNPLRARPQLRGLSSSRVAIMIDGERLNNSRFDVGATGISPNMIDVNHLDAVEVVAGAGSSLYGSDAVAGSINLITKAPRRPDSGVSLDLRGDLDFHTKTDYRKGGLGATLAGAGWAAKATYSYFELSDTYEIGGDALTREESLALGNFAQEMASTLGNNVAGSYGVYELPGGGEMTNSGGEGYNFLGDLWIYPKDNQNLRIKYMRSRHENLGRPGSGPPWDPREQVNLFRNYDKFSARYEILQTADWLPRISFGFFRQNFHRPQNDFRHSIVPGSSYEATSLQFTGRDSEYVKGLDVATLNDVTAYSFDLQLNIQPFEKGLYTTGVAYFADQSRDDFSQQRANPDGTITTDTGLKTTPDTDYKNLGWFNQLEYTPVDWFRFSGGFRVDNWKTEANPSEGFPAGSELAAIYAAALPIIAANPGDVNVAGIQGIDALAAGTGSLTTDNTVVTYNVGATFPLPGGINPFVRYGTSYREPEVTVRYLVRNFGSPIFSIPSLPNTEMEPEKGKNLDVGVKLDRRRIRASVGYFRNDLENFAQNVYTTVGFPADPANGLFTTPWPPWVFQGYHSALFFQRVSRPSEVHFEGFETQAEASLPLGDVGSLTPSLSLTWLKSTDDAPSTTDIQLVEEFFNRSDTPIELEGGIEDIPARNVVPWQGSVGLRFTDRNNKFWAEYEWRFSGKIKMPTPEDTLATANSTTYGILKSLEGFRKHSIRAGYSFGGRVPVRLTLGVENLTDETIFSPLSAAPLPGRQFIFGLTFDWRNMLGS